MKKRYGRHTRTGADGSHEEHIVAEHVDDRGNRETLEVRTYESGGFRQITTHASGSNANAAAARAAAAFHRPVEKTVTREEAQLEVKKTRPPRDKRSKAEKLAQARLNSAVVRGEAEGVLQRLRRELRAAQQ